MRYLAALLIMFFPLLNGCDSEVGQIATSKIESVPLPPLHLQPEKYDMGTVKEGDVAKGKLFIRNNTDRAITITDVQTSCGCTVAKPASMVIQAGGFTTLDVRIDSTVKRGDVKKSVRITDSEGHVAMSILSLKVTENPHLVREGKGLFDGKCATCHYDPVLGKMNGKDIYDAACVMCHGEGGKGAYAPGLTTIDDETALSKIIANGTGSQHMPGFAKAHGGPLTDEQVNVLTRWLLSLD